MEILEQLQNPTVWQEFLTYKKEKQHLSVREQTELENYIREENYRVWLKKIKEAKSGLPLPARKEINKGGSGGKRVVYSFPAEFQLLLKIIAFSLYRYDNQFAPNCYAFRRDYGVKDAIKRIRTTRGISQKYCLKVDIHDYFNSISVPLLLEKLSFLKEQDDSLFRMFEAMLTADAVVVDGEVRQEKRGAMAGTPVSSFWANVYFMEVDWYFENRGILYFRYSDDILIFADTKEELSELQRILYEQIKIRQLSLNPDKVHISEPGEMWEFLGFCYRDGKVELSENTKRKLKGKIKRKAHALRRWQEKKNLSGEKAAIGFIRAMNHKFFDDTEGTDFSWSRWFFPNLTTEEGLREIDAYMQQYVRYCVTGRHYKGNYKITYEQMKAWGYRSLVHEYYIFKSYH
jgi:hypothetical protein